MTMMVVDDAESMRTIVADLLGAIGVGRVLVAESGADALDQLAEVDGRVDLIICDIEMPEMNGFEFVRRVRYGVVPACKDVPIMILTGHSNEAYVKKARTLKISGFVDKPVSIATLRSSIDAIDGL